MKKKQLPVRHRTQGLEPGDSIVDKVVESCAAKSPVELVLSIVTRMGYISIVAYDVAARRAERYAKKKAGRIPNHIRDKFVLKRVVERSIERQFGIKAMGGSIV